MSQFDATKLEDLVAHYKQLEQLKSNGVPCHRFYSWNLCYEAFGEFYKKNTTPTTKKEKDLLALHLGSYLVTLGMYRGATFNLHYNYSIHRSVITLLFSPEAQELRKNNDDLEYLKTHTKDIKKLYDEVYNKYAELFHHTWKDIMDLTVDAKDRKASSILISEVLLGTIGCLPAYDTYLKKGLEISEIAHNISSTTIEKCVTDLLAFFEKNIADEVYQATYKADYPIMKLLDIAFWKLGSEKRSLYE